MVTTWLRRYKEKKQENRLIAYTTQVMERRKQRLLFDKWRIVSHRWFKEHVDRNQNKYRADLERRNLSQYSNRVDELLLRMADLEDKVQQERESREALTRQYEASLNQGVHRLNDETAILADNPLIKEISLVIANQLQKQGGGDLDEMVRLATFGINKQFS